MVDKVNGASRRHESLSGNLQYYTMFTTLDIETTGDLSDTSQQDFELVVQTVGLRTNTVVMTDAETAADLTVSGSKTVPGAGFVWKFVTERGTGVELSTLVNDFDGLILAAGTVDTRVVADIQVLDDVAAASTDDLDTETATTWTQAGAGVGATLTADAAGTTTIDGYLLLENDRVLIKDQTTDSENGIYVATDTGVGDPTVLTRATDMDQPAEFVDAMTAVVNGTVNGGTRWITVSPFPSTIDTDPVTFEEYEVNVEFAKVDGIEDL